jgi:hypothetical protein
MCVETTDVFLIFCFRILLNYFKWDKEKLMEKYFSDDQDAMFAEAHVVSPYRKPLVSKIKKSVLPTTSVIECEICCLSLPKAVRALPVPPLIAYRTDAQIIGGSCKITVLLSFINFTFLFHKMVPGPFENLLDTIYR